MSAHVLLILLNELGKMLAEHFISFLQRDNGDVRFYLSARAL